MIRYTILTCYEDQASSSQPQAEAWQAGRSLHVLGSPVHPAGGCSYRRFHDNRCSNMLQGHHYYPVPKKSCLNDYCPVALTTIVMKCISRPCCPLH